VLILRTYTRRTLKRPSYLAVLSNVKRRLGRSSIAAWRCARGSKMGKHEHKGRAGKRDGACLRMRVWRSASTRQRWRAESRGGGGGRTLHSDRRTPDRKVFFKVPGGPGTRLFIGQRPLPACAIFSVGQARKDRVSPSIITSALETNRRESRSCLIIPC
jgi:hypothetical protein